MFTLRLLGGLGLLDGSEPLAGRAVQRRRLALLALLGTSASGSMSRDKLIGYLWPEHGTEQARRLLTVSVYELRKALGEDAILAAGNELRLNPQRVWSDAGEFKRCCRGGLRERAVELYVGPLADGFYVAGAPEFERWLETERERYGRAYQQALEELAEQRSATGDPRGSVEAWRRLVATDALNTRYALGLMQALESAGDRAGAVRHAGAHARSLREELGAEPNAEVESLALRLRREPRDSAAPAGIAPASVTQLTSPSTSPLDPMRRDPRPAAEDSESNAPVLAFSPGTPVRVLSVARARSYGRRVALLAVLVLLLVLSAHVARLQVGGEPSLADTPDWASFGPERSIAVLPFQNMSAERENDYFSDGMTEDIITRLAQIPELKVISRASVMQYGDDSKSAPMIARELGVGTLLKGSVRRSRDRIRITVQLIDARNDRHLWADSSDHELTDVFAVQSEIAQQVARVLQIHLSTTDRALTIAGGTQDLTAYDYFLQARRYHYHADGPEDNEAAIKLFRQATEIDPVFALAYAGLGNTYAAREEYMPGDWLDSAQVYVATALSLDARVDYAYDALGTIYRDRGRLRLALETYHAGLGINPQNANVLSRAATVYGLLGHPDSALVYAKRGVSLDPASPSRYRQVAVAHGTLDDLTQAEHWHRQALRLRPDFVLSRRDLFYLYLGRGEIEKASAELNVARSLNAQHPAVQTAWGDLALLRADYATAVQEFSKVNDRAPNDLSWSPGVRLAYAQLKGGNHAAAREQWDRAEARLRRLVTEGHQHPNVRYDLARLAAMQARKDEAYVWLGEAIAHGFVQWRWMRIDPLLENLQGEPRFEQLLAETRRRVERLRAASG